MKKSKHTEKLNDMRDITCRVGCGCGRGSQMQTRILAGRMKLEKVILMIICGSVKKEQTLETIRTNKQTNNNKIT